MPESPDYQDILDHLHDGVYFVDRDRTITYWNQGAARISGYGADRVLGRSCRDGILNHVTANGVALCQNGCPLTATMEDGKPREADVFLHHADGHRVPVLVRCAPLRDASGAIVGDGTSISVTLSLGATHVRADDTPESVVARADALMYRSKEAGRDRVTVG